jgi:hypothetical protein
MSTPLSLPYENAARYVHDHLRMRNLALPLFDDLTYRAVKALIQEVKEGAFSKAFGRLDLNAGQASGWAYLVQVPEPVVQAGRLIKRHWPFSLPRADRGAAMRLYLSGVDNLEEAGALVKHLGVAVERDPT